MPTHVCVAYFITDNTHMLSSAANVKIIKVMNVTTNSDTFFYQNSFTAFRIYTKYFGSLLRFGMGK